MRLCHPVQSRWLLSDITARYALDLPLRLCEVLRPCFLFRGLVSELRGCNPFLLLLLRTSGSGGNWIDGAVTPRNSFIVVWS
jgi:hypothetical protein